MAVKEIVNAKFRMVNMETGRYRKVLVGIGRLKNLWREVTIQNSEARMRTELQRFRVINTVKLPDLDAVRCQWAMVGTKNQVGILSEGHRELTGATLS
ncbi:hypothetical protein Cflav_PD4632 [Pedosphaera parvula Ellin514]|uniref:Uncharacterized protein n=1 Tax=Pedosphaera parvula (strain Ellin514) TaxID=320771 RepID=B9XE78_PEDPL|nr:hypothetical protein Cflav_PD4632 [Pedosphaera parvula Ellin514]